MDAFLAMGRNIAQTSRALGISRPTLYKKLRQYRLSPEMK
jgi:transcriptional regulator of acetoin/glycerol metabolism